LTQGKARRHVAKIMAGVAAPSADRTAIIDFIRSLPKNSDFAASSARA
jgi:hypothetical protein